MSRFSCCLALFLMVSFTATAFAAEGQTKTGVIESVDAKTSTFVVTLPARPLMFKVDEKTVITLDGKASTFDAAIKVDLKVAVTYAKSGEDRLASKVDVTSAAPALEAVVAPAAVGRFVLLPIHDTFVRLLRFDTQTGKTWACDAVGNADQLKWVEIKEPKP